MRQATLHVWDIATGKLAVPLLPQLKPDAASTQSVGVAGDRAVVCATKLYSVLDLSTLLPPIEEELPSLLRRAELATNQKLQVGELVPLESHEWSTRWEQLVAARQTPEMAAESLARAFDEATDAPAQSRVIARAKQRGLLERLQALRPKSVPLLLAFSLDLKQKGRLEAAQQVYGQVLEQLRDGRFLVELPPENLHDLAHVLVGFAPNRTWLPLEPTEMTTSNGAALQRQPNGFILAEPGATKISTYSIHGRAAVRQMAALQLIAAPHESLPSRRFGFGGGNFDLTEVRARVRRGDGSETPVTFRSAVSDYIRPLDNDVRMADGPWSVLDGNPLTRWDLWLAKVEPHWLALNCDAPIPLGESDTLIVELDSGTPKYPTARIGHFRLMVSEQPPANSAEALLVAVNNGDLPPAERIAAACLINGEGAIARNILEQAPQSGSRDKLLRALLLAAAQQHLGQHEVAQQTVKAAVAESPLDPWPHSLTGFYQQALRDFAGLSIDDIVKRRESRAAEFASREIERELARLTQVIEANPTDSAGYQTRATYLMRLGRWHEAAEDWASGRKLNPDARNKWFGEANCRLLAGEEAIYKQLCQDMVQQFRGTTDAQIADSVTKTCLLRARTIDRSEVPVQLIRDGLNDPTKAELHRWFAGCSALASYREGKFDEALAWAKKHPDNKEQNGALALVVLAMAEHQLGQHAKARQTLAQSEALIPASLATLGTPGNQPQRPVPTNDIGIDWLPAELLRREAASLIHNEATRRAPPLNLAAGSGQLAALGRWSEAANAAMEEFESTPTDRTRYARAGALLLMAGDVERYRQHCETGLKTFGATTSADVAELLSKNCLLIPDAVDRSQLPLPVVRSAITDPKWSNSRDWFVACLALAAYREGQPEAAFNEAQKQSQMANDRSRALMLVVRALAEVKLGRHELAEKSLQEAESLIPAELRTLGTADYTGPLPVPTSAVNHDRLINELLRREAAAMIRK